MYHVAIIGESLGAQVAALACAASGFHDIDRLQGSEHPNEQLSFVSATIAFNCNFFSFK